MRRFLFSLVPLIALAMLSMPVTQAAPLARPTAAVQALLDRAAKEPAEKAPQTLDEAARLAESTHDTAGELAVAEAIAALGKSLFEHGDLARARELVERALAVQEKLAPNSLALAASLN